MMKYTAILGLLFLSTTAKSSMDFETTCRSGDCLHEGWSTTGLIFELECQCTNHDCVRYGWTSKDNFDSTFVVTCKPGGCLSDGWFSIETKDGQSFLDDVTCKHGGCLVGGWGITNSYDVGGSVTCNNNDCGHFGGVSYWRKHHSTTTCYDNNCYEKGWTLTIEEDGDNQ